MTRLAGVLWALAATGCAFEDQSALTQLSVWVAPLDDAHRVGAGEAGALTVASLQVRIAGLTVAYCDEPVSGVADALRWLSPIGVAHAHHPAHDAPTDFVPVVIELAAGEPTLLHERLELPGDLCALSLLVAQGNEAPALALALEDADGHRRVETSSMAWEVSAPGPRTLDAGRAPHHLRFDLPPRAEMGDAMTNADAWAAALAAGARLVPGPPAGRPADLML